MKIFKALRVGDPHVTVGNLKESQDLMNFILQTAKQNQVDWVEFLGDLFHTHAVVRSEVLNFWVLSFNEFAKAEIPVRALVGNHDQVGDREREYIHALIPFKDFPYLTIIDRPMVPGPSKIAYLPYMADCEEFIKEENILKKMHETEVLVCHQTFQGSTFENGFYAEDGIDLSLLLHNHVISGHIHKAQQIGKCDYPGTAKWDKATDAGSDKGIWLYEHEGDTGKIVSKKFISTANVVTPIYRIILKEGEEEIELPPNARIALELHGQTAWITKMKKKYKGSASIRAIPVDRKTAKVDNSKLLSLKDFAMSSFNPIAGVTKEDVINYIEVLNGSAS